MRADLDKVEAHGTEYSDFTVTKEEEASDEAD